MESYESGRSVLLEKIEDMYQAIDRLTAENRSTRVWFKDRLQSLWETTSRRDEVIARAMKGVLDQAEEMSRRIDLRDTGHKLEAMLKGLPADRRSPPFLPPNPSTSTVLETATEVPDSATSKKRPPGDNPIETPPPKRIRTDDDKV